MREERNNTCETTSVWPIVNAQSQFAIIIIVLFFSELRQKCPYYIWLVKYCQGNKCLKVLVFNSKRTDWIKWLELSFQTLNDVSLLLPNQKKTYFKITEQVCFEDYYSSHCWVDNGILIITLLLLLLVISLGHVHFWDHIWTLFSATSYPIM